MSPAEETQNKKRRNLMVTTMAVIIAAFLGLKFPAISAILPLGADPADIAWRFWTVPAILVLYQFWRWSTDSTTKQEFGRVGALHKKNFEQVAKRHLVNAVRKSLQGRRTLYDIRITTEIPDGADWNWRKAYLEAGHYPDGNYRPICDAGQATVSFVVHSSTEPQRSVTGTFSTIYEAGSGAAILFHAQASVLTLWHSPDCQDVAVPWFLTPIALGICAYKMAILT